MGMKDDYEAEAMEAEEPEESMALDSGSEAPELDEFEVEARAFLDAGLPIEERTAALKNAIMACQGTDYGAEPEMKGDSGLGALFGSKK